MAKSPAPPTQALLDALDVPVATLNRDGTVIATNRQLDEMFPRGLPRVTEWEGDAFLDALSDRRTARRTAVSIPGQLEKFFVTLKWLDGCEEAVATFITADKWESELNPWKRLLNATPDPVLFCDRELDVVLVNNATRMASGSKNEMSLLKDLPPERAAEVAARVRRCFEENEVVTAEGSYGTGENESWYRARYVPIAADEEVRLVGVAASDISDRWRAEQALQRSEERYRELVENSQDLVAALDLDTTVQFASPSSREVLGYDRSELEGTSALEVVHPADVERVRSKLDALVSDEAQLVNIEARVRDAEDSYRHLVARARKLVDAAGETTIVVNARDVTSQRESESMRQNLSRADKLAAIGQLAAGVAHEVNNPASYVMTNLFVMREYARTFQQMYTDLVGFFEELGDDVFERANLYLESKDLKGLLDEFTTMTAANLAGMERITQIVQDLQSFARDDESAARPVELNEIVDSATNIVRNQVSYYADLDVELGDTTLVIGDRGKLQQVLINLLVNAAHAVGQSAKSRDGMGKIEVRTGATPNGEAAFVEVSDDGPGIPSEVQARIFEPFFTTKPMDEGTGLGLWMCAEIVRKHRGQLTFETTEGEGTTFRMQLPSSVSKDAPSEESHPTMSEESEVRRRLLIVDDDELVLDSYRKLLGDDHDVMTALGGEDALDILGDGEEFDVIICDIMMPSIDGLSIHEALAETKPDLLDRTVFCTAGVFTSETKEFVERLDASQVVYKPLTPRQLRDIIRRVTASRNGETAG